MTKEEIAIYIKKAEKITKKACRSQKAAHELLYKYGFVTKSGKLRKEYRDD